MAFTGDPTSCSTSSSPRSNPSRQTRDGRRRRAPPVLACGELNGPPSNPLRVAYDSLGAFVRALRRAGELATVDAPVDPRLEIAEITDRVVKAGGPALLFTKVRGSRFPVLTNQFGTERRAALAFGAKSVREG